MFKIITHQGNAIKTTIKYTAYIYPYNSAVPVLGTFPGEMNTSVHKKTCVRIIIIALFVKVGNIKQSKCLSAEELWYIIQQ